MAQALLPAASALLPTLVRWLRNERKAHVARECVVERRVIYLRRYSARSLLILASTSVLSTRPTYVAAILPRLSTR